MDRGSGLWAAACTAIGLIKKAQTLVGFSSTHKCFRTASFCNALRSSMGAVTGHLECCCVEM